MAATAVLLLALLPSIAGALSVSTGNGRAPDRERESVLPGQAVTEGRLLQLLVDNPARRVSLDLGQITAEAARSGGLFSELIIEGLRMGEEEALPQVAFHSDAEGAEQHHDDVTLTVNEKGLASSLALANWTLRSAPATGAVSQLDLLSGTVQVPGVGLKANIGERGFVSQVTKDKAHARFAITLEDFGISLDNLLPDTPLPLGTALHLVTQLDLPLGDELSGHVARVTKMLEQLAVVETTLADIAAAKTSLTGLVGDSPAVKAALAAVDAAEAAVAKAANDLVVAAANVNAARMAADTATAAADAANATVAAAQQDVANATATVQSLQAQVAGLDLTIAALQQELASTLDPVRLAQIPGEILAAQNNRDAVVSSLTSAEAARSSALSVLTAAQTSAAAKSATAAAAQATLAAAESAAAAAGNAVADAQSALTAAQSEADAALAAAAVSSAAVNAAMAELDRLQGRLRTVLQTLSDVLATLPPLPDLEKDLDDALRSAPVLAVGGLALETLASADREGSTNSVHCTVERVSVLGLSPDVEECTDLIAMEKEAVRRVNEVLHGLGAIGVEGVQILGPGGTWSTPGPVGPDGKARSYGQMAVLSLSIPAVDLNGVAANLLGKVEGLLAMIKERPASAILVPTIRPNVGKEVVALAVSGPEMEAGGQTLGQQLEQVSDEMGKVTPPDALQNLSTGAVRAVVAEARTDVEYDTNGFDDQTITDPTEVCGGDPVCLAQCAAGQCPKTAQDRDATGVDGGAGSGGRGSGSDEFGLPLDGEQTGAKLPMTGTAGGLAAVAMLAVGSAGVRWVRRRPHP